MSAIVRARFLRATVAQSPSPRLQSFPDGLLSRIDAIMEVPMMRVLENIPLGRDTRAILRGGNSKLRPLYDLMIAGDPATGMA